MKTPEEKAKSYDRAVEQAEKEILACGSLNCDAARLIFRLFPDLKESEDEKIRKKLIGIFTNQSLCDVYNLKSEDVLAYLKRQKEQKPVELKYWDKEIIQSIISILERDNYFKVVDEKPMRIFAHEQEINYLRNLQEYLYPNLHWKPSELEKAALRTAIYILTEERNFPKAAAQLQNILNAFEGEESRKDWKPSEEQLKELNFARLGRTPNVVHEHLDSLYNDLLKLK